MRENILVDKTIDFAARIVKLHKYLIKTHKETIIAKQIFRSGTSIGANINKANHGQSTADFISKMHIALKETAETEYWLKLLVKSEFLSETKGSSLINDCLEIKRNTYCFYKNRKRKQRQKVASVSLRLLFCIIHFSSFIIHY